MLQLQGSEQQIHLQQLRFCGAVNMGEVIVALKVMPKTIETNLDLLEKEIREAVKPEKIQRNPIAFGIVAFNVAKIVPDSGGEVEKIENKLKAIKEVGDVEVVEVMRTL